MSRLTIYSDTNPKTPLVDTQNLAQIQAELLKISVELERWHLDKDLPADADHQSIIAAYQNEIDKLVQEGGYQSYDVVTMNPDEPNKTEFRQKFLSEHIHDEDEVRFFVRGQGLFVLHIADKIYSILCQKDDLISVPAYTKHWFDMGPNPEFTTIRIFDNAQGWTAEYTGEQIADQFPKLDN